jgi:type IV pilus assembly protein PilA
MNHKAFTLIELLVVVAIIGILAAVGVVAYNGYTSSAKKNASIANFKNVAKYISNEVMKCDLGEGTFAGGQPCPVSGKKAIQGARLVLNKQFKNPFDPYSASINTSTGYNFGYIDLSANTWSITIRSCHKEGCASAYTQETIILLK